MLIFVICFAVAYLAVALLNVASQTSLHFAPPLAAILAAIWLWLLSGFYKNFAEKLIRERPTEYTTNFTKSEVADFLRVNATLIVPRYLPGAQAAANARSFFMFALIGALAAALFFREWWAAAASITLAALMVFGFVFYGASEDHNKMGAVLQYLKRKGNDPVTIEFEKYNAVRLYDTVVGELDFRRDLREGRLPFASPRGDD